MNPTINQNNELHSPRVFWLMAFNFGAIGMTGSCLVLLLVQLVYAGEPYRRGHTIWIVAALIGFVTQFITSAFLLDFYKRAARKAE